MAIKYINIDLIQKKRIIGTCEFVSIVQQNDFDKIEIKNLNLNEEIEINHKVNISILILINKVYLTVFDIQILEFLQKKNQEFTYKVKYFSNKLSSFNQVCLRIFNEWQNEIQNSWEGFESVREKYAWIKCCNILNGVSTSIDLKNNYIINGNNIKHPVDLHCLFGELFMGKRGYMGKDYNSFIDCLTQVGLDGSSNKHSSKITILNYEKLDKTISKFKNHSGYIDAIINEFKISGFHIIKR
ncbi:MAG: hypothetical protein V4581_12495 [Bacteroidota bacterium]